MLRGRPVVVLIIAALFVCLASLWPRLSYSDNVLRRVTNTTEDGLSLNPSISGDGRRVAFESTEDLATSGGASSFRALQTDLATNPSQFLQMATSRAVAPGISKDGSRVVFASTRDPLSQNPDGNSEIFLYSGTLQQITNTTPASLNTRVQDGNFEPSISDDGRFIAFSSNRDLKSQNGDANLEVFVFDNNTQAFTQITNSANVVGSRNAKISGDGSHIAYLRDSGTSLIPHRDLVIQDRVAGSVQVIAANANTVALTYGRAISDDGTRVVYSLQTATNTTQVFLFDSRTGFSRQITSLGARAADVALNATISGDGKRIAFATRRNLVSANSDGGVELFLYDLPTGQFSQLTNATSAATAEVVSSLSDDGSIAAFNFPRVLSGAVANPDFANNSEIYTIAITPRASSGTATILNGASLASDPSSPKAIAPDSIALAQGSALSLVAQQPTPLNDGSFPLSVGGTTVTVNGRPAQILYVSPGQVNFLTPPETAVGPATVVVNNSEGFQSVGSIMVLPTAPGVFTVSGNGAGDAVILNADTSVKAPFDPTDGTLRLLIFATGVRNGSHVTASMGGQALTVEAVLESEELPGLDEIHVLVPSVLRGAGTLDVEVKSDNQASNSATTTFSGSSLRDIMINEVLADPPGSAATDLQGDANHDGVRSSSEDEFVELVNSTSRDIAIGGYQLLTRSSSATTDTLRHTFAAATILPACSAIVVFGGGNPDQSNPLFGGAQVVKASSGLSLSNTGGVVTLRDNTAALITSFAYGGSTGLNGGASQSMTRSPDVTGNFVLHQSASGSGGKPFSSGMRLTAAPFAPCPAVARIDLSATSATIDAGAKQQFTARSFDAAGNEVFGVIYSWQSSNASAATIDQTGLATGVAGGSTEIRASGRGALSLPATLTVREIPRVLTTIEVTPPSATIPATGAQQFTGHGLDQFGNEIAGVTFTWESTNTNAATIDQTGLATGVNQGQATIRASSQGVTGTATLNVTAPTIVVNEVLADPAGSAGTDLQGDANHDGVRSASDDEFVELVNSTGAGISLAGWTVRTRATGGTTETTRHTFAGGTTLPASGAMVVFGGGTFDTNNPVFGCAQVVKASSGGLSLTNTGLSVLIRDAGGNLVSQMSYGAEGNNDQSLTRSPDITGAFVQHQAASGANSRRFSPGLKVDGTPFGNCPGHPASVTIAPPASNAVVGQTTQFSAQAFDQFGRAMTGVPITFASDNTTAATIESVSINPTTGIATATVMGRNQGTAHITAQANDGTTTATSSQATLTVIPPQPQVTRIDVTPANATINRGHTQQFNAAAFDQNNQPVAGVIFTWSSSNTGAATIDQSGLATGGGIGATTIAASASDGAGGTVSGTAMLIVQVPLLINEINADVAADNVATSAIEGDANRDGVRDSSDDEFVELLNNSVASVDISGIVIADATSNRFTIPANTTLASGRALVIFGGGSPSANDPAFGGALVLALSGSGTLSLNDTGDTVNVKLSVGGSDVLIASQTYGGTGNPAAPSDQSLTRSPDAEINSNGGSFGSHTVATNAAGRVFSPGTRTDGTPFGSPGITRIEVTPVNATINAGQTQGFTARAFSNAGGPEVEIQDVCFIWESSDTSKTTLAPTTGVLTTATGLAAGSLTIRARAGGQLGTATLTVNVPPTLTINDVSQSEGNVGTTTFHFVVSLSAPALSGGVTFDIATQDNTATIADDDYVARSLPGHTIAAGQQTYDFDVTVNGDVFNEPNETFFVNVTHVSGATLGDGQGVGTIQNDDDPSLVISDVSASEGNSGTTTFTFTVTSTLPAPAGGITFDIATADSTATVANNDYVARSLTSQAIPVGQTTYDFAVTVNGDLLVEPNENFLVNISNVLGATVSHGRGVGTIQNDDAANLVISQIYPGGGLTGASFTNDFIEIFNRDTTAVDFSVTPYSVQFLSTGAATWSKTDLTSGTLAPGHYFLIREATGGATGAQLPAPDATGSINLTSTTAGKLALVVGTTLITGNCPGDDGTVPFNPVSGTVADFLGYGGNAATTNHCYEGSGPASFTLGSNTIADFRKAGGCTETNDNAFDFVVLAPHPRNSSSAMNDCNTSDLEITKTDSPDPVTTDSDVTYTITLSNNGPGNAQSVVVTDNLPTATTFVSCSSTGTGVCGGTGKNRTISFPALASGASATITLVATVNGAPGSTITNTATVASATTDPNVGNNSASATTAVQAPVPALSIGNATVVEGNSGTKTVDFTVTLSSSTSQTVMVSYATSSATPATATAGVDYQSTSGTLTFNPGETSKPVTITINGDTLVEPDETFFVNLSSPTNATIQQAQGVGTIQNDDTANLVISQIYPGGGLTGASFTNDFVEIFNRGTTTVDFSVTSYSAQFLSTGGSTWSKTDLASGVIGPGRYFLIREASGGANGAALPAPDTTGTINLTSTAAGKVALVSGTTLLTGNCPGDDGTVPFNPASGTVADFLGYGGNGATANHCYEGVGPASFTLSNNTIAVSRKAGGCTDTNDNSADFLVSGPFPRNSTSPANNCIAVTPPNLTINDVSVTEGNSGTTTATFTVSLSVPAPSTDVTFDIATLNDTATTTNNDYVARNLTNQVIPAGQTIYSFAVTVNGDNAVEPDETFFVNVTNVIGATVADGTGKGTILNDDFPTISINDVSANEGNSGTAAFTFTVSLSAPAPATITFDIATQDNSATVADNDYVTHSQTGVTIAAGQQTATFDVTVNGDTNIEPNESFFVNVTNVSGATLLDGQGVGTIQNDDSPVLTINDVTANEGNSGTTTFTFTVSLSQPAQAGGVTFDIATANGTATASGGDYGTRSLTSQTIPAGQSSYTFDVTVNGDTLVEPNETFFVDVTNVLSGATVGDGQGLATITNDDTANLAISQLYGGGNNAGAPFQNDFVEIFNRGTTTVDFSVTPYSVQYAGVGSNFGSNKTNLTAGTIAPDRYFLLQEAGGNTNGAPLPAPDATGTIAMGNTSGKVALVVGTAALSALSCPGDDGVSPFNPSDPLIADFAGYGSTAATAGHCYEGAAPAAAPSNTTADFRKSGGCMDTNGNAADFLASAPNPRNSSSPVNDCSTGFRPDISINDPSAVTEGDSGTTTLTFNVTLSAPNNTQTVTVNYATADGTATAGADYQTAGGTVTFNPTETTKPIVVTINSDLLDELNETFFVNLSNATNGVILDSQGQGTINDNDPTPTLSINDLPSIPEGDDGTSTATFTVTLSAASGRTVTVNYATADGTANAGRDYVSTSGTLTFDPGDLTKQVPVTINGDPTFEPNEMFFVNLATPVNATIADSQGQGTITNDDAAPPTPNITINDPGVTEGNSGTRTLDFTVSLSMSSATIVTVDFATASAAPASGVATAGTDYVAANGTITFNPGETSKPISITINGDTLVEPDETLFVNLTNASPGSTITDVQGLGTINNDDTPNLVISQVFGGGGNAGAAYQNDFVEILNRGTTTVDFSVTPYSVQYASSAGNFTAANKTDLTTGSLAPGQYFLVKLATGGTVGQTFTADVTNTTVNMSATDGKVALVIGTTVATTSAGCPTAVIVADLLGYGSANCSETTATAVLSATKVDLRRANGCTDTNNNSADFTVTTVNGSSPLPRNSSSPLSTCP